MGNNDKKIKKRRIKGKRQTKPNKERKINIQIREKLVTSK